jgi:hypothetical protein
MTAKLIPLRLNELLGFVRRCHSASPEPLTLILLSNVATAAWRFKSTEHSLATLARGSQHSSSISTQGNFRFVKAQDSLIQFLSHIIQQKPNAAVDPAGINHITTQVLDDIRAHSARVEPLVRFRATLPFRLSSAFEIDSIIGHRRCRTAIQPD